MCSDFRFLLFQSLACLATSPIPAPQFSRGMPCSKGGFQTAKETVTLRVAIGSRQGTPFKETLPSHADAAMGQLRILQSALV